MLGKQPQPSRLSQFLISLQHLCSKAKLDNLKEMVKPVSLSLEVGHSYTTLTMAREENCLRDMENEEGNI